MKEAIRQMMSTRVSGFVAIAEYAEKCISEMEKTSTIDVFSQGCGVIEN